MRRLATSGLLSLVLGILPASALAADSLTILYTGDNAGEVAQCGCKTNPAGGLPRRKSLADGERKKGPVLVLDSGNALFSNPGLRDPALKKRAKFVLEAMGKIGTAAMAVGARDLDEGSAWLKTEAAHAGVTALSANLVDAKGNLVFPASKVVEAAGKKIALIGVSPEGPVDLDTSTTGKPMAPAVLAEARKLRKSSDLVIVLAAVPYSDSLQLSNALGGSVDFILQSHEGRGSGAAQKAEGNFVLPSGDRGRAVGRLVLDLSGEGPFVDSSAMERDDRTLKILDDRMADISKRLEATKDPAARAELKKTLATFEARKKQVGGELSSAGKGGGRKLHLDFPLLTSDYNDDPGLAAEVSRIEPTPGAH
jgi:2',3'-cyclic-nucleotide 2'-phosphodiesterase (5'-nucleotidase family)